MIEHIRTQSFKSLSEFSNREYNPLESDGRVLDFDENTRQKQSQVSFSWKEKIRLSNKCLFMRCIDAKTVKHLFNFCWSTKPYLGARLVVVRNGLMILYFLNPRRTPKLRKPKFGWDWSSSKWYLKRSKRAKHKREAFCNEASFMVESKTLLIWVTTLVMVKTVINSKWFESLFG
ncbi:hypothetical protein OGAPHI_006443 [Ogataea philodendri]|uniref:Uncharacterized protein n=1 Tax=Ogataea philodendri TaxID=1378263 RepID=A0A9P8T161_9ASCO|nr:uncharacterized protein OGAPHI_006443 [Ogataea philodendri]KAH3661595.1 hypothetical protein OGAPHI_006443 [Ogataea philodendri]